MDSAQKIQERMLEALRSEGVSTAASVITVLSHVTSDDEYYYSGYRVMTLDRLMRDRCMRWLHKALAGDVLSARARGGRQALYTHVDESVRTGIVLVFRRPLERSSHA